LGGQALCVLTGDQAHPVSVSDRAGGAIVVWQDSRTGSSKLSAMRITSWGALASGWPAGGLAVCSAALDQTSHAVAADGAGGAFIAWEDYRTGGADADIYLQRVTANGTLATGWPAGGVAVCTATGGQSYPAIAADTSGAFVVWQDRRGASSNIYAQRVNGAGVIQWAANGLAVCAQASDQQYPAILADGSRGAVICWEDQRSGGSDLYAQRVNASGVSQWAAAGVAVCTAALEQDHPRLLPIVGGSLVVWDDSRNLNTDIYAQSLSNAGVTQWATDGVPVCADLSEQYASTPVSDGAGGMFVAWNDFRNASGDIYLQRVTPSGAIATGWPLNGKAACSVSGNQFDPVAVSDGSGGVILSWDDFRDGSISYDIYAQRLTATGAFASGWPSAGLMLCGEANDQLLPSIVGDQAGGAVITWYDFRSGNADVYAMRVTASGGAALVGVDPADPGRAETLEAYPNPMRSWTALRFALPRPARVTLEIVDLAGRTVRALAEGASLEPGVHAWTWDGRTSGGGRAPAGVYLVVLHAGPNSLVRKVARVE